MSSDGGAVGDDTMRMSGRVVGDVFCGAEKSHEKTLWFEGPAGVSIRNLHGSLLKSTVAL